MFGSNVAPDFASLNPGYDDEGRGDVNGSL